MKRTTMAIFCLMFLLGMSVNGLGQRNDSSVIDEVVKMSKAKVADDIIIAKFEDSKIDLSVDQILQLKNAGVSDRVIRALMGIQKSHTTSVTKSLSSTSAKITEVGFYLMNSNQALPTSYFKTQKISMLGMATMGIKKAKQKASIAGASASVRTNSSKPSFLFYAPEGTSANDYVIIKLEKKSEKREITVGRAGMFGGTVGFDDKRIIKFSSSQSATRRWVITVDHIEPGEYAFYPTNGLQLAGMSVNANGKLYEFGID